MSAVEMESRLRRIVTVQSPEGSVVALDDGPSARFAGLSEIWREDLALVPTDGKEQFDPQSVLLAPPPGGVVARWFLVEPPSSDLSLEQQRAIAARTFERVGAAECHRPRGPDPTMHQTATLDLVCLLSGRASLVLDGVEEFLSPGDVVVQRGTAHAWRAHDGPALFFAVLIDKTVSSAAISRKELS